METITKNENDDIEKMSNKISKNELELLDTGFSMAQISITREDVHER